MEQSCANAVQAFARYLELLNKEEVSQDVIDSANQVFSSLKRHRSQLEGSESPIKDDPGLVQEFKYPKKSFLQLKSLVKGNTLSELKTRENTKKLILEELRKAIDESHELLFVCLKCSHWFAHSQDDRQSKSRKNCLFFVFRQNNRVCLGIENQHASRRQEFFGVEGKDDWISGREIRSFIELSIKSQYSYISALCNSENILFESQDWIQLKEITQNGKYFTQTKQFIQRTISQGISFISERDTKQSTSKKKKQKKQFSNAETHLLSSQAQQDISYFSSCIEFLIDCILVVLGEPLSDWKEWDRIDDIPSLTIPDKDSITEESLRNLMDELIPYASYHIRRTSYNSCRDADQILYETCFAVADLIREYLRKYLSSWSNTISDELQNELQSWLGNLRLRYCDIDLQKYQDSITFSPVIVNDLQKDQEGLKELIDVIGDPLKSLHNCKTLFLIENGSRMYNLSLKDSDRDYIAIYSDDPKNILSNIQWPKESADNRGHQYEVEHCCYEVRLYCELLLKGNPSVIELLFSDKASFMTDAWQKLVDNRMAFISEAVVFQYVSWVEFHLKLIRANRNPKKIQKYFYHAFHKLFELERLLNREPIKVSVEGEERDFILAVRNSNNEGNFTVENLMTRATNHLNQLKESLSNRNWRYPESGDWKFLQNWLLSIRTQQIHQ